MINLDKWNELPPAYQALMKMGCQVANADMLSNYDYWQFWRNTEDGGVARCLTLFTLMPLAAIARLAALEGAESNEAKKILATEATALVRGREAAEAAAETARKTFEQGALGDDLPVVLVPAAELAAGIGVLALSLIHI